MLRDDLPVDDRRIPINVLVGGRRFTNHVKVRRHQPFWWEFLQLSAARLWNTDLSQKQLSISNRNIARGDPDRHAALNRCASKEPFGGGHRKERFDFSSAAGLAENGNLTRIAAK